MAFDQLSVSIAVLAILLATGYAAHSRLGFNDIPTSLQWVGRKHGFFADLRTRLGSIGTRLSAIGEGYGKYSKVGLSFILPSFDRAMVLVPKSQVKWVADQADDVLNAGAMQNEVLQTDWSLLDSTIARNPIHEIPIRRDLTRSLGTLIPDIDEELTVGVDEYWGKDTENWVDVGVFTTMMKIVSRTSNRIFVGLPLCRDENYLNNAGAFSTDVAISGALIRLIPTILKPLLAWIILLPNRWHLYQASKSLLPFIRQRMVDLKESHARGETKQKWNDFTTWYLEEVADHPDPRERDPKKVVKRLMAVNFAAIHTSTFTATNIFFDLVSSPNAAAYIQELREEIEEVLSANHGKWDKNALAKLVKTDSAIRESLRISTFMTHGMDRMVVSPNGVTMQDGLHLSQGTRITTSPYYIHHDSDIYKDPEVYDPFRFSRGKAGETKVSESTNVSIVNTSDTFLSFGHGRHACPGRFFAAAEMKLLLAYIILNYDIKPLQTRPSSQFIGETILPPLAASIFVKRRAS